MKEPSSVSPFATLNHQEQKEQWICWQCQQKAGMPEPSTEKKRTPKPKQPPELPALKLPNMPAEAPPQEPPFTPRHGQYDAVLKRMRNAGKRTTGFQSWLG